MERPRDLARYVLEHATERAPGQVERLLESRERTRIDLTETIPVYIAYLTAWVEEDGRTSFHQDLYGRDEALARELAPIS